MDRPKTAIPTSHLPGNLAKFPTSPYKDGNVTGSQPRGAPGPSHHPRSSLFTAFGLCMSSSQHDKNRCTTSTSFGQGPSPDRTATASDIHTSSSRTWSRRPSVRLTKVARAVFGNGSKYKDGSFASKQNDTQEPSTTKSPRSNSWLQSLTTRCGKQARAITLDTISTELPIHIHCTRDAPVFDEDDHTWDVGRGGGAAARAAAAAQNEMLELKRQTSSKEWNRLRDLKLTSDSESGIGIEIRDLPDELGVTAALPVRRGLSFQTCGIPQISEFYRSRHFAT